MMMINMTIKIILDQYFDFISYLKSVHSKVPTFVSLLTPY